jgi:hypothetical protein
MDVEQVGEITLGGHWTKGFSKKKNIKIYTCHGYEDSSFPTYTYTR